MSEKVNKPEISLSQVLSGTKKIYALYNKEDEDEIPDMFLCITKVDDGWMDYHLLEWSGGVCNTNEVHVNYINEGTVKWDCCSHIYFYGEDALVEPADSYYHVCGTWSYVNMINSFLMINSVAYIELNNKYPDNKDDNFRDVEYLNRLLEVFNKKYEVKEIPKDKYTYSVRDW